MSQPQFAKCQNFGCEQYAEAPFLCCDSACGYENKNNQYKLLNYQNGNTEWYEVPYGIKDWTIEQLMYYANV